MASSLCGTKCLEMTNAQPHFSGEYQDPSQSVNDHRLLDSSSPGVLYVATFPRDANSVSCPHDRQRNCRAWCNPPKLVHGQLTGHLAQDKESIIFQGQQSETTQPFRLLHLELELPSSGWLVKNYVLYWVVPQHTFFPQSCLGKLISPKALLNLHQQSLKLMPRELQM